MKKLKVLFISSEIQPYSKTGGLADVSSALPKALKDAGADIRSVTPLYSSVDRKKYGLKRKLPSACVHMGNCEEWFSVYSTDKPDGVETYFIEFEKYFGRRGFYNDSTGEFGDNLRRFSFFARASLQTAADMGFYPDIVHSNDWQTSFVPYYLKADPDIFFPKAKSVLTIHNIGYQGIFDAADAHYAAIYGRDFNPGAFESLGRLNSLKGGIAFADKITTVSPTYAEEILGPIGSGGLHDILDSRRNDLLGILNGVDVSIWNPLSDRLIEKNYGISDHSPGKRSNKKALQRLFGLDAAPNVPVFAFIGRFADQKGLSLLAGAIERAATTMLCQIALLGSGDPDAERYFGNLPAAYPGIIGSYIGYDEKRAHLMEAGADFFMMPSLYEPCGLNQMYSQIYGTLPVVRATGGLDDTVDQYDERTGGGTGFKFYDISPGAFYNTIGWAVSTYFDRPAHMKSMIKRAMSRDFSWKKSAAEYMALYEELLGR